ncbi:hypothetical protein NAC44_20865 [Allorhizobium sp. BGMRC 0089]|uniref:hypothetical protein n=1 Tax=Allorhizobium sonneratiae TaxID=2934936 RepID=UPI002033EEEC|nr:hypothetical protein [Allorhizobium sonneratiae]MCM2294782.1 hypothetical protein [Allorhizobium sonneratiae]
MNIDPLLEQSWQSLLDKDDRTSPPEYPDMCLITRGELEAFLVDASFRWKEHRSNGIQIEESRELDSGSVMGFFARGHYELHKFAAACNEYTGADPYYDRRHVEAKDCRQEWWRTVPVSGEPGVISYHNAEPHSRGAFAVTVTHVIEDRDRKQIQRWIDEHHKGRAAGFADGLNWALRQLDRINVDAAEELLRRYREQDKKGGAS